MNCTLDGVHLGSIGHEIIFDEVTRKQKHMSLSELTFDRYFELVLKRNSETHEDGHLVAFTFDEEELWQHLDHFREYHKLGSSPHTALTAFGATI